MTEIHNRKKGCDMGTRRKVLFAIAVLAMELLAPASAKATSVTIFFDNEGPEAGITVLGATGFSFAGSTWAGGIISATGLGNGFVYQVDSTHGPAWVLFDEPVDTVEFSFLGGTAFVRAGTATAFDSEGNFLQSVDAVDFHEIVHQQQSDGFVRLDPDSPVSRIEFTEGFIDDFTFTLVPEPASGTLVALGATLLAARRVRKRSGLERDSASPEASRR